jgi:hypothetical protein
MATMARYNFPAVDYDSLWAKSGFADDQGPQNNKSAFEQAKDELIANVIKTLQTGCTIIIIIVRVSVRDVAHR